MPFDPVHYRYEFVAVDPERRRIVFRKEKRDKPLNVSSPSDPMAPRDRRAPGRIRTNQRPLGE